MRSFTAFLVIVCGATGFGQSVMEVKSATLAPSTTTTSDRDLYLSVDLKNDKRVPVTVSAQDFVFVDAQRNEYKPSGGTPLNADGQSSPTSAEFYQHPKKVNPRSTITPVLLFVVPSSISLAGSKLCLHQICKEITTEESAVGIPKVKDGAALPGSPDPKTDFSIRFGWYVEALKRKVAQNWYLREVNTSTAPGTTVYVEFTVALDGTPDSISIRTASSSPTLDSSCLHAVQRVDTFGRLPDGYSEPNLTVIYHCTYPGLK